MVWVNSEYAGEFAVVSAWLSALLPWYVGYAPETAVGPILYVRFPLAQVGYVFAIPNDRQFDQDVLQSVWGARGIAFASEAPAYDVWLVGAAVVGLVALLGVAMYVDLAAVEERLPVEPVRAVGALLAVATAVLALATIQLYRLEQADQYVFPVGLVVMAVLAAMLLRAELVGNESAAE